MITSTLYEQYTKTVAPQLKEKRGYKNPMEVPRITKIVVNTGVGTDKDREVLQAAVDTLASVTGQKPVITKSRLNISNFKLREGMVIGAKVTLRGDRMYEFMDRLVSVALPRIRDFRGLSPRGFDGHGNYTFGIAEQTIFPEIDPTTAHTEKGMDITFCTTTSDNKMARELLTMLGVPFIGANPTK